LPWAITECWLDGASSRSFCWRAHARAHTHTHAHAHTRTGRYIGFWLTEASGVANQGPWSDAMMSTYVAAAPGPSLADMRTHTQTHRRAHTRTHTRTAVRRRHRLHTSFGWKHPTKRPHIPLSPGFAPCVGIPHDMRACMMRACVRGHECCVPRCDLWSPSSPWVHTHMRVVVMYSVTCVRGVCWTHRRLC
jgi:hypothetical protein